MPILEIIEVPNAVLSTPAREVRESEFGPALQAVASDMAETMFAAPGVGLAAPQIGISQRILVANLKGDEEHTDGRDHLVTMVNPTIVERGEGTIVWEESCLSLPGLFIDVTRPSRIRVEWRTPTGEPQTRWFEDFPAVVVQHEMDHLDGVTLFNRASRLKRGRYLRRRKKLQTQSKP
ncbi:MAG: peptide deformylase [Myxococcota bacterium]|nr:peptide deformylase [Myxococcota bacterium]